jgi:hypothetical protein
VQPCCGVKIPQQGFSVNEFVTPKIIEDFSCYTQAFAYIRIVNEKLNRAAQALGRLGGKAGTGKVKARTSKQARAAVMARWNKPGARKPRKAKTKNK